MFDNHFPTKHKSGYFSNISRLGIIGGMGIVASSKFHYDISQLSSIITPEQQQIQTILLSYPNIPDKTESIIKGNEKVLTEILKNIIIELNNFKVSHIIICCYTLHIDYSYLF